MAGTKIGIISKCHSLSGASARLRESIRKSNDALSDRALSSFPPSSEPAWLFVLSIFLSLSLSFSARLGMSRNNRISIASCVSFKRSHGIILCRLINRRYQLIPIVMIIVIFIRFSRSLVRIEFDVSCSRNKFD